MAHNESAFKVQLTVLDWDKLSSKDHVGDAGFVVADLIADAPQRDKGTELHGEEVDGGHGMKEFKVLRMGKVLCPGRRNLILLVPSGEFFP